MIGAAVRCSCGTPMREERSFLSCAHCDRPCKTKRCAQCQQAGVKR